MNKVFIGVSLDGYIADKNGGLDFLETVSIPEGTDTGYFSFMESVDALLMGKNTFETVAGFDVEWPYKKPVYVLSNSLRLIPIKFQGKAFLINGELKNVLAKLESKGHKSLYIDGGSLIQSFLKEDLIDVRWSNPFGQIFSKVKLDFIKNEGVWGRLITHLFC